MTVGGIFLGENKVIGLIAVPSGAHCILASHYAGITAVVKNYAVEGLVADSDGGRHSVVGVYSVRKVIICMMVEVKEE